MLADGLHEGVPYTNLRVRIRLSHFSNIDSFYPFSCCLPIHNLHSERPYLSSHQRHNITSTDSYQSSKNSQPYTTPRTPPLPRLPSIPILPLPPASNSTAVYPVVVFLSLVSVISISRIIIPDITV